jgi:hypothetical protein
VAGAEQSRVYSVCGGDEGHLWAANHSDEEKCCHMKNISKNAERGHMNFVQTREANEEGEDWETETLMNEDGATKTSTSEDKARGRGSR